MDRKYLRNITHALLAISILLETIVFAPNPLESLSSSPTPEQSHFLLQEQQPMLAPGIPYQELPEYSIEKFSYLSISQGEKQWRIQAKLAFLYKSQNLTHAREVTVYLYDQEEKETIVSGKEAKYFFDHKNLEIFGEVFVVFPDGFQTKTQYLRYLPDQKRIEIPTTYLTQGKGHQSKNELQFTSYGLIYDMNQNTIELLQDVLLSLEQKDRTQQEHTPGVPHSTQIQSDHCIIDRNSHLARFSMHAPQRSQRVQIKQPKLFTKCRRADLNYGDFSKILRYLTAYEDVWIQETPSQSQSLRYATGGRADFDTHEDTITISEFPQAYQDQDTVTGDLILMHRATGIIEIQHSNAFSTGILRSP